MLRRIWNSMLVLLIGLLVAGCSDDDSSEPVCGNGILEQGEECDSNQLGETVCNDLGYAGGDLGCTAQCTFDTTECTGGEQCGDGVVDAGEECDGQSLGGESCGSLGFDGGDLLCTDGCAFDTAGCCDDACQALGESQCVNETVEVCVENADGCLEWQVDEDCAATDLQCVEDSDGAFCAATCSDECDASGDQQCDGALIEICEQGNDGCLHWQTDTDCSTNGETCAVVDSTPQCVASGPAGDTCASPIEIGSLPFNISGVDFAADYSDSQNYSYASDCASSPGGTPDLVLELQMTAGETIWFYETGDMDSVLHVMDSCEVTSAICHVSEDLSNDESAGVYYRASSAQTVYLIVESWHQTPSSPAYDVHVEVVPPETDCANSTDDDGDGLTDCEDPDCFGQTGCTTEDLCDDGQDNDGDTNVDCADDDCAAETFCEATETTCDDSFDNDGDGDTDCDDTDCSDATACLPMEGVWERFHNPTNPVDFEWCSITFTDTGSGYDQAFSCPGLTDFPVEPGTGDYSDTLMLQDDDSYHYSFQGSMSFDFFGVTYSSLWVGSNGFVTFENGDDEHNTGVSTFFAYPRVAALGTDLDPTDGGSVYIDEFADRVVVTYEEITSLWIAGTNSFQIVLNLDGSVDLHYVEVDGFTDANVGISNGGTQNTAPAQTDLVVPPTKINEIVYDRDGVDDWEFVELKGPFGGDLTGHTLVHYNGSTGDVVWQVNLTGQTFNDDGLFVFGHPDTANVDYDWDTAEADNAFTGSKSLQNDSEAVVVYLNYGQIDEEIVDAVQYGSGASFSFAETAPAPPIEFGSWQNSIGRFPDGFDSDDNSADFVQSWWPTPGEKNTPAQPAAPFVRLTGSTQSNEAGTFPISIPDNDPNGVSSVIDTTAYSWFDLTTVSDIHVGVRVDHFWPWDLEITLTAPDSTVVTLHDQSGNRLHSVYDLVLTPDVGSMADFDSIDPNGQWTLTVSDNQATSQGELIEWVLWIE